MGWLSFEPLIPSSLWTALAVAVGVLLAWYAAQRPGTLSRTRWAGVVVLHAAAALAVLLLLLNPTWVEPVPPPPGKPLLTVLVDESASMGTPDATGGQTRHQAALKAAAEFSRQLGGRFDVRVRGFAKTLTALDLARQPAPPLGRSTDLAGALSGSIETDRPQGQALVLLSDGIHNAGPADRVLEAVRMARAASSPIYTVTLGADTVARDVSVELRSPQDLSFIQQQVPLRARVKLQGGGPASTNVTLMYQGKEIARQTVVVHPDAPEEVRFLVGQDKPGLYPYEVRVEPLPGETNQANNSASYLLRVVSQPVRVLVLEGKPYWDNKFLLRTLAADPAVAVDSIVKLAEGRFIRRSIAPEDVPATPAAPAAQTRPNRPQTWSILTDPAGVLASPQTLKDYQVIVLGRDAEVFLTDAAINQIQNWVSQEGGALVCSRGSPTAQISQKLARLMPVRWTPARESHAHISLTPQGRDLQWLPGSEPMAALPPLARSASVDTSKPLTVVLATVAGDSGKNEPAVVYQPYGTGRVIVVEGAGMWRWAFLPPQNQQLEDIYGDLWRSLLRWLASSTPLLPGQNMSLRCDKVRFDTSEPATVTLLLRTPGAAPLPKVELRAEGAAEATAFTPAPFGDQPGSYRVAFGTLPDGRYQARVAGAGDDPSLVTVFDVRDQGEELLNLRIRPDLMARIATDASGKVVGVDGASEIASHFAKYMDITQPQQVRRITAWDRFWILAAVIALWTVTWYVRRSGGLV
ncbi:MAG: hypothetical protein ACHRHE_04145 [Tepidisphaerales bacterium]